MRVGKAKSVFCPGCFLYLFFHVLTRPSKLDGVAVVSLQGTYTYILSLRYRAFAGHLYTVSSKKLGVENYVCFCLLSYLSLWLSSTLDSPLAQATPFTVVLSFSVNYKIIDILPVMNSHSAHCLPVEFGHIFHAACCPKRSKKMIAMETACARKSLKLRPQPGDA